MLDVALNHEKELISKYRSIWYDKRFKFFFESHYREDIKIYNNNWNYMQFVSLNSKKEVIGFIEFSINRDSNNIDSVSIVNFSENYSISLIRDLYCIIQKIFEEYSFNKIKFSVLVGNPIEKSYDKIVSKYGGRIVGVYKDEVLLSHNTFTDSKLYEITREDYFSKKGV